MNGSNEKIAGEQRNDELPHISLSHDPLSHPSPSPSLPLLHQYLKRALAVRIVAVLISLAALSLVLFKDTFADSSLADVSALVFGQGTGKEALGNEAAGMMLGYLFAVTVLFLAFLETALLDKVMPPDGEKCGVRACLVVIARVLKQWVNFREYIAEHCRCSEEDTCAGEPLDAKTRLYKDSERLAMYAVIVDLLSAMYFFVLFVLEDSDAGKYTEVIALEFGLCILAMGFIIVRSALVLPRVEENNEETQ